MYRTTRQFKTKAALKDAVQQGQIIGLLNSDPTPPPTEGQVWIDDPRETRVVLKGGRIILVF